MRAIIHCLLLGLFGESLALPHLAPSDLAGIGLSDWAGYAGPLLAKFNYTNTFYHQEPRLDIAHPAPIWHQSADFVICSDVFEHVPVPAMSAFIGAAQVLRSGGLLVMTVPYEDNDETIEHYPSLHDFSIVELGPEWVMTNRAANGTLTTHRDLIFHGGPGSTLEMRLFSRKDVLLNLYRAGFTNVGVHDEHEEKWGIFHAHHFGLPITARKV